MTPTRTPDGRSPDPEQTPPAPSVVTTDEKRGVVWIVDDSPLEAEMARRALASRYDITLFAEGTALLERLASDPGPDALVLDWQLPGMSGIEVCRFLRATSDEIALPIVMLTVHGHKQDIIEGLAAGANDYVTKPYDAAELLARVGTLVRTRRLHERAKQAEQALAVERDRLLASERRFRLVTEAIPQIVWTADADGALDYVNQRWTDYTGMSAEDACGAGWQPVLHPDDRARSLARWQSSVESGAIYENQHRFRRAADGAYRWFLARALPLRDARGRLLKWFGTYTDIDDQKRAEAQIDALLEGAPVGIGFLDRDLHYLRINEALAQVVGIPKEAHIGRTLAEVLPGVEPHLEPIFRRVIESGEPIMSRDVSVRRPDGKGHERHFLANYFPVRIEGQTAGIAIMMTDITDRKRAEQTLDFFARASIALSSSLDSRATCESMARLAVPILADFCGIYLRDSGTSINLVADAHAPAANVDLLRALIQSHPVDDGASHGVAEVLRTGRSDFVPDVAEAILAAEPEDAARLEELREIGVLSWMMVPLVLQERNFGCLVFASFSDERRYDELDLSLAEEIGHRTAISVDNARLFEMTQRERARVEEANRTKDEFLATVSHELRTPLNAILGWTVMLRSGPMSDEKRARALETIERNARAQTQLIEDLLDISRIISGKLRLNVSPVQPYSFVEAAIETVRPAADAKGVRLQPVLDSQLGPILGDPERLQQIIWNLLSNAVKFTPKGGRVHVRLQRVESDVEIVVADTGRGIPPEFLPYVFDRFRQADAGVARMQGGLGLGLAITRHLIELHGGSIEAKSPGEGLGSTFAVRFPLAPLSSTTLEPPEPNDPSRRSGALPCPPEIDGLHVLVVEDEPDARELMVSVLEGCKARVTAVATAAEALEAVRTEAPDVLVSDVGLPGESGYDLIRKIRALGADQGGQTPAVALTAYARMEDRTRALTMGFDIHVPKPIEPSELLIVIAHLASRFPRLKG